MPQFTVARFCSFLLILQIHFVRMDTDCHGQDQPPTVRNILLIMSDDLRTSVLPAYGNSTCRTPNLDRLAAAGMVFERAYCQGLMCAPSRPSIMRSIYPGSQRSAPTIGEHLQQHQMHTARVGKIFHMPVPRAQLEGSDGVDVPACWTERYNTKTAETFSPGLYRQLNSDIVTRRVEGRQGAGTPNRPWTSVESDQADGSDQADYQAATRAIELLQQRRTAGQPFFLAVGFVRPHYPMVQPASYFALYPHESLDVPPLIRGDLDDIPNAGRGSNGKGLNERKEGRQRMWQAYYASVSFMDAQLGRVLDELDRLGLRDSTAVVFTTDHGYHLGEHGFWQKANLHEDVVHVPLIISVPGMKPGRTSSLVELVDIYPTCTELLGLPTPRKLHGLSLVPLVRNPTSTVRTSALSIHRNNVAGLRAKHWHYMNYGSKGEELYDMVTDPEQYTNVVDHPDYAQILVEARRQLARRLEAANAK